MAKAEEKSGTTPLYLQVILLILVLGLIFVGLKMFVFNKLNNEIKDLTNQANSLDAQRIQLQTFENKKAVNEQQYQIYSAKLSTYRKILPQGKETDALILRLEKLANETSDLQIKIFRPEKTVDKGFYYEWPITIDCDAGFNSLGSFFEQIANFERIFNVYGLEITSHKQGGVGNKPTIKAKFTACTFVYKSEQAPNLK